MIVAVIRHAKVNMKWKLMMTSAGYDKGCADYDTASVLPVSVDLPEADFERIYVSALPRTTATARQVFEDREFDKTALFNEVPERAGFDTGLKLPMFFWSLQEMEKQGFQVDHKRLHYTNGEAVICRK